MIDRRKFIGLTTVATASFATHSIGASLAPQDPYDTLISGQNANDVQFIEQIGQQFIGDHFNLTTTPTRWTLNLGRYIGRYYGKPVDLHGYWIYMKGTTKAWQAVNRGGGALKFWNEDGHAAGNPEDWELFTFEAVDRPKRTVRICNASYMPFFAAFGHLPAIQDRRYYVGLKGNTFACNETSDHAAIFAVQF